MTVADQLTDMHFKQYESRLKHMEELFERANKQQEKLAEFEDELGEIRAEKDELIKHLNMLKQKTQEEWQIEEIEQSGPLLVWDAVAKRLEKLVEKIER